MYKAATAYNDQDGKYQVIEEICNTKEELKQFVTKNKDREFGISVLEVIEGIETYHSITEGVYYSSSACWTKEGLYTPVISQSADMQQLFPRPASKTPKHLQW